MIEPPIDELAALFTAERAAPVASTLARTAARAKLAAAVGTAPLGTAAAGAAGAAGVAGVLGGATIKVLAVLAITVGAGVGVHHVVNDHSVTAEAPPARVSHVDVGGEEASAPAVTAPAVAASAPVGVVPSPSLSTSTSTSTSTTKRGPPPTPAPIPSEASLLRAAWAEPDPARALAIVQRDAQLHPGGALAEERAVIEVRALANLHRYPEARTAAAQVIQLYPESVHRALVERVLDGKDP